jgi:16S rRNA (guanine527-N7)-methyltransferase
MEISNGQICEGLSPFSIFPSEHQLAQIREYILLLLKWNRSINLTSIKDPLEIVGRHFGESMFLSKLLPVENCRLADVGTGAGFPGLALKTVFPSARVTLIESNKKKCAFLSEVVRELDLMNVEIVPERFELIRPKAVRFNIITSRAVGEFKQLLRWSSSALAPRGHLALWVGGEDTTRIARAPAWSWQPAARLPDSQRRFILIGRPMDENSRKVENKSAFD